MVHFDQPWWLLAMLAGAAPAALALRAARRGRRVPAWAVALQCAAVAIAAAALARPAVRSGENAKLPWLVLRDVSDSTRGQDSNLAALAPNWPAELPHEEVAFSRDVLRGGAAQGPQGATPSDRGATFIRPPLQLALGRAGELAGVVLATDGQWQDERPPWRGGPQGDRWEDAAGALRRSRMPVLIVPLADPPPDARIAEFRAARRPPGAGGAPGGVLLRVTAAGNSPQKRTLVVTRQASAQSARLGGPSPTTAGAAAQPAILLEKEVQLLPGEPFSADLADESARLGDLLTYHAELRPADAFPQNDAASATVLPEEPSLALISDESTPEVAALVRPLAGVARGGWPAARAPRTARELMPFSAVLLVDPNGGLLDEAQRAALAEYVRQGGGLLIVGAGPHVRPEDRQDPLNRVAALVPNPYERRPLRVVVVLDASGSMGESAGPSGGRRKYDLAEEAVASMRSHLTPRDSLAVIVFSDSARKVYDSGTGAPDFSALREAMGKVQPAGPTVISPALEVAAATPPPAGQEGLVIVVSDLAVKPFDEAATADRFRRHKMGLSVVEVQAGPQTPAPGAPEGPARPSLRTLARLLEAPVVPEADLSGLAEIFGRFIRRARGDVTRRGTFRAEAEGPAFATDVSRLPALDSYILCATREGAEVLARIGEDPVLARRAVGPGRTVSIALPLSKAANAPLLDSAEFAALVSRAASWAMRPWDAPGFTGDLRLRAGQLHLVVDAVHSDSGAPTPAPGTSPTGALAFGAAPLNLLHLTAHVARLGGDAPPREVPLEQTAPGRYEAALAPSAQPAVVQVVDANGLPLWRGVWEEPCPEEFAAIGPNWANLQRLAALTGGRIEPAGSLAAGGRELLRQQYRPLAGILLALAAALMLIEWAAARIVRR